MRLLVLPLAALSFALLIWPAATLALDSIRETGSILAQGKGVWSFANYAAIFRDSSYREALLHSVGLSAAVAIVSTALCLGPAWLFVRRQFFGKRVLRSLFALPMCFSGIIVGFLVIIMVGRIGFIPQLMQKLTGRAFFSGAAYQFSGLLLAYIYFEIPRAILTLESSLKKFDFQLESAARSLGAGRWQRLFLVVLPILRPALLSTLAVTFTVSLGSFGAALILSRRFSLLPVEIFQQLTGFLNTGLAAAMSMVLAAIALAAAGAARWAQGDRA